MDFGVILSKGGLVGCLLRGGSVERVRAVEADRGDAN